jgi:cytoskeletal protein CcmA (bactofilin family)
VVPGTTPSALKDIVAPRRPKADSLPSSPGHRLVVGRDIVLTGEIEACESLIIEGRVEGEIANTQYLEIAESGRFKGSATVQECVVAGACEGDITVSGLLTVRSNGRIKGKLCYAEIEIQRGGRLSGEVEILTVRAVPDPIPAAAPNSADSLADAPASGHEPGPGG